MNGCLDDKKWFVLVTKSRWEKKVSERLTELSIENFLPINKKLKKWKDRKSWVEEPLIKGYVFVKLTEKTRKSVFPNMGISRYLFVSGKIAKIYEEEIAVLKLFCTLGNVTISTKSLEIGTNIEIISGKFIGIRGELIKKQEKNKIKIYISTLNFYAIVDVLENEIKRVVE